MTTIPDSPGIRFCWCPPMENPDDPNQHEAACAHAAFVEQLRAMQKTPPTLFRHRTPARAAGLGGCREASFGWVHIKPGCHCPR